MTGCRSRRFLFDEGTRLLRTEQPAQRPFSLVLVDVDHFKVINDGYGHDVEDSVLKHFVGFVRNALRASDVMEHMGSEELLLLLPSVSLDSAVMLTERLRSDLHIASMPRESPVVDTTLSEGASEALANDELAALIKRADHALYSAQANGQNQVMAAHRP